MRAKGPAQCPAEGASDVFRVFAHVCSLLPAAAGATAAKASATKPAAASEAAASEAARATTEVAGRSRWSCVGWPAA